MCHDAKLVFLGVWLEGCEKIGAEFDIHLHEIKMAARLKNTAGFFFFSNSNLGRSSCVLCCLTQSLGIV